MLPHKLQLMIFQSFIRTSEFINDFNIYSLILSCIKIKNIEGNIQQYII